MPYDLLTETEAAAFIKTKRILFWDFDGVIKESLDVKTKAFETLFIQFGTNLVTRIREHHESHGGVSRFEKIPLYLKWAGISPSSEKIEFFCNLFSKLSLEGVISSPWVTGVPEYLKANYKNQYFVLVTAIPQNEIEYIVQMLDIKEVFGEIYGSPKTKSDAIAGVLERLCCDREEVLMIGDSKTDFESALANSIEFLLRRTPYNIEMQNLFYGPMFQGLML